MNLAKALPLLAAFAAGAPARGGEADPPGAERVRLPGPGGATGLVDHRGRAFSLAGLEGKPWIAGFVFTRCGGPCPQVVAAMSGLARALKKDGIRFVAFTVDPEHDTPEVLSRYAALYALEGDFRFATAEREAMYRLIQEGFKLGVARAEGTEAEKHLITHSQRLALLDASGEIRGYYDALDPEAMSRLEEAARNLARPGPSLSFLPALNASLNGASFLCLTAGILLVKRGRKKAHERCMWTATCLSALFLVSYTVRMVLHGTTSFPHGGLLKTAYLAVLFSHMVLAMAVPFLVGGTIRLALKERWEDHKRWARRTYPIWMYVSVTGVLVYWMLYHL